MIAVQEITPFTITDCFLNFSVRSLRRNDSLHYHDAYELIMIKGAKGARRVVGTHQGEVEHLELVLIGPGLPHGWFSHQCSNPHVAAVAIHFDKGFIKKMQLPPHKCAFLRKLLEGSQRGILFSKEASQYHGQQLLRLSSLRGFDAYLGLISLLQHLALSSDMTFLSKRPVSNLPEVPSNTDSRVGKVMHYLRKNYDRDLTLSHMAALVKMSEADFSQLFRQITGSRFLDNLTEIRLGNAARLLMDTDLNIQKIALKCGFSNSSYFNRLFKQSKGCSPKAYRSSFWDMKLMV